MEELPKENKNGDSCNKQRGHKKQKSQHHKLLCELLLDFAKNTTLHGLRYVTERGLSAVEKIFWIITFLISLSVCLWLMGNVWMKWQTSPVLVTLSEKLMSVTEVPFPAVTICPQAKIKQSRYNYTDNMIKYFTLLLGPGEKRRDNESEAIQNITQQNRYIDTLRNLGLICNDEYIIVGEIPKTDHTAVIDIVKIAPQLDDIFDNSYWRNEYFSCEKLFDSVLTNEGLCFTFNSLAANEIFDMERIQTNYSYLNSSNPRKKWSLEGGYSSPGKDSYPRRGRANSAGPDLIVEIKEVMDRDQLCDRYNRGFKVYLHHPADLPQSSLYHYAVPPGQTASFAIKVNVMKTSDRLTKYSSQIRQCYFPSEKKLRYFRTYTLNNCHLECSTNYTLARCKCVWFHMPHNDGMVLCDDSKYDCVIAALEEHAIDDTMDSSLCKCLPSCDTVQYEAEVTKTKYNARAFHKAHDDVLFELYTNLYEDKFDRARFYKNYDKLPSSRIEMYFKESRFVSMRRSELFGLTDFLANCGGLLGLFLGFSFLSLVEIFYFFTLRLGCMFRRNRKVKILNDAEHVKII